MKSKKYPLVLVEWDDACNMGTWHDEQEIDVWLKDNHFQCQSVGWLVRNTKNFVVIAARVSWGDKQYGLLEKLPRKMIKKIKVL